jgi:hypothetical protein
MMPESTSLPAGAGTTRTCITVRMNGCLTFARSVVSLVLLVSFLSSVFLPYQYQYSASRTSGKPIAIVFQKPDPESLLEYLLGCCLTTGLSIPEPEEESDAEQISKVAKDFLPNSPGNPFSKDRLQMHVSTCADINVQWTCYPLQQFSPPPEFL